MKRLAPIDISGTLVKDTVADRLRAEIANGKLRPGVRIVEGFWARKLGVAQGSIREAINLLAQEGFVTKASGRSARVVNLTESDVLQIYEMRGALEGLAARLLAARTQDVPLLEEAVVKMSQAAKQGRTAELIESDLKFHLELCRLSDNPFLLDHARRLLLPLFAFIRIRVMSSGQKTKAWHTDLDHHQRLVDLIEEGQGEVAQVYVQQIMARSALKAYLAWEEKPSSASRTRQKKSSAGKTKKRN
jgi:DNA-binding GntR family transcriptional regulator